MEEQSKKSERRFRLLVETTRYALSIFDRVTLLHTYVSRSVSNILGYTPAQILGLFLLLLQYQNQRSQFTLVSGVDTSSGCYTKKDVS